MGPIDLDGLRARIQSYMPEGVRVRAHERVVAREVILIAETSGGERIAMGKLSYSAVEQGAVSPERAAEQLVANLAAAPADGECPPIIALGGEGVAGSNPAPSVANGG